MTGIFIPTYGGMIPRKGARELGPIGAQVASNCKLLSGELRSWLQPADVATPSKASQGEVLSIFRMSDGVSDFWLNWLAVVNVARGPVAGDTTQRIFWTGDGEPRMSNLALATTGGTDFPVDWYVMGVYQPTDAPDVTVVGGSGSNTTISHIYTFVTQYGEEGAPSEADETVGKEDGTWQLSMMEAVPPNSGTISGATHSAGVVTVEVDSTRGLRADERVIHASITGMTDLNGTFTVTEVTDSTHYKVALTTAQSYSAGGTWERAAPHNTTSMTRRIYATDATGTYRLVEEIAATLTSLNYQPSTTDLGDAIEQTIGSGGGWYMPPANMTSLIEMPNQMLSGLSGNLVCFCEPGRPHAWPTEYQHATNRDGVALGAYGSTLVVGTRAQPYLLVGTHPSVMTPDKMEAFNEPCLSAQGMSSGPFGVSYSSPSGRVRSTSGGTTVATLDLYTKREWDLVEPDSHIAVVFDNRDFVWYDTGEESGGLVFDWTGQGPVLTSVGTLPTAAWTDPENGRLYIVVDGVIQEWDADTLNQMQRTWKSGIYITPKPVNFGWAKIKADFDSLDDGVDTAAQIAADTAYNEDILDNAETYGTTFSNARGCIGESLINEFWINGSLLVGGLYPNYEDRSLIFKLYAKNSRQTSPELWHTETVTSEEPFRLTTGDKHDEFEVQIEGNVTVYKTAVTETMRELKGIEA